jgi:dTMP kinase
MLNKAKFITIEGSEGVGKTTNIEFILNYLNENSIDSIVTREPGGTENAEKIRDILLNSNDEQVPEIAELLLFFSARSFHVSNKIIPELQNGKSVICDRFNDATIAYQGYGRGFDVSQINMLSSWVLTDLKPDITILLDAPADIGMQRTMNRGYSDRMESEDISFYERVRKGYLNLANEEPNRFRVIDATQSLQEVQADIKSHLDSLFQIA